MLVGRDGLTDSSLDIKEAMIEALKQAEVALEESVQDYNDKIGELFEEMITPKIEQYNTIISQANRVIQNIGQECEYYINERSDYWQESYRGEKWARLQEEYDDAYISPIEDYEITAPELELEILEGELIDAEVETPCLDVEPIEKDWELEDLPNEI